MAKLGIEFHPHFLPLFPKKVTDEFEPLLNILCSCGCAAKRVIRQKHDSLLAETLYLECGKCSFMFAQVTVTDWEIASHLYPDKFEEDAMPRFKKVIDDTYRKSEAYKVDQLLEEIGRWKRKRTIAANKLADLYEKLESLSKENAVRLSCLGGSKDPA